MRQGMFPGQMEALRDLARKGLEYERRTRRNFLLAGIAAIGTAAAGVWVGARWAGRAPAARRLAADPRLVERLPAAHRLAAEPDDILRRDAATFLLILEGVGGDDILWTGYRRLVRLASDSDDRRLGERLLTTARTLALPAHVEPAVATLRQRLR